MSSVDGVGMCGGVWDTSDKLSKYFHRYNHDDDGEGLKHLDSSSPYLYSSSAPVGPTSCEYCGQRNTADCTSNLPHECFRNSHGQNDSAERNNSSDNNPDGSVHSKQDEVVCHRPKLFFLKKRPPFATPDGWNPVTQYRTNLFEPPSSVEGMGRGWGEVRGRLGNNAGGGNNGGGGGGANANNNAATTMFNTNNRIANNQLDRNANSGCGSSACGVPKTEVSFSSAGGDRGTNVSASEGGARSLSPVQWVSGLMGALSPSK